MSARDLGGLLLTGGRSSRMGRDKAGIEVDASRSRTDRALLVAATTLSLEVGPGWSSLDSIGEEPQGAGPLGASSQSQGTARTGLARDAACIVLAAPAVVVGCGHRSAAGAPETNRFSVIDGVAQPLCARWSATISMRRRLPSTLANGRCNDSRPIPALQLDESTWGSEVAAFETPTPGGPHRTGRHLGPDPPLDWLVTSANG